MVVILLDHRAPVDKADGGGWTPLHYASVNRNPAVVVILLDHGASIDKANARGYTSLHLASSEEGHIDVMRHLLAAGASRDIAAACKRTPLDFAEMCNQTAKVKLLTEWPKNLTPIMNGANTGLTVSSPELSLRSSPLQHLKRHRGNDP